MSHLNNFASKFTTTKVWRVVCMDDADLQAATALGYQITEEWLQGKQQKVAFSSQDKIEAARHQDLINNKANTIRMPKGCDSGVIGKEIKRKKQERHDFHQEARREALKKRRRNRY